MSVFAKLLGKKKKPAEELHRSMADFLAEAEAVVDEWIAADPDWFQNLPYAGAMSSDEARRFEIERLATWNRVIFDAGRSKLPGLRWDCRDDEKSCPECRKMHGRIFALTEYDILAAQERHLGCRCELIPVRDG